MLIHDRRLEGNAPHDMAANVYDVNEYVPIRHALAWVGEYARRSGGLTDLFVMCHGYEGVEDYRHLRGGREVHGGYGLALCHEGLALYNASLTSVLRGKVTKITIFACSTADTASYNAGTEADGARFCGEIALWTGAEVIAAIQTQRYHRVRIGWQILMQNNLSGTIDFGAWEGPVYSFSPGSPNGHRIH